MQSVPTEKATITSKTTTQWNKIARWRRWSDTKEPRVVKSTKQEWEKVECWLCLRTGPKQTTPVTDSYVRLVHSRWRWTERYKGSHFRRSTERMDSTRPVTNIWLASSGYNMVLLSSIYLSPFLLFYLVISLFISFSYVFSASLLYVLPVIYWNTFILYRFPDFYGSHSSDGIPFCFDIVQICSFKSNFIYQ